MLRRTVGILAVSVLLMAIQSCARLEPAVEFQRIPADWGNLVAVATSAEQPDVSQLWFQDADGNIRVVVYALRQNRPLNVTLLRRQ